MPTDNVGNLSFEQIFKPNIRFEIPFFQRGYAWEKKQWDQLFTDIKEQILEDADTLLAVENNEHFFGPIVVLGKENTDPTLQRFMVIDGQQRITTIYLLLALIKNELEKKVHDSHEASGYVNILNNLIENDSSGDDDYKKLKVFSSKGDRLPTFKTIFEINPRSPILTADVELYNPETNNVDRFRRYVEKRLPKDFPSVPDLWKLCTALLKSLKIVWIPLKEGKDDPQAIFESLNDRGMPLSAAELLCNYIFKPLIDENENFEDLHNNKWLKSIRTTEGEHGFEEYLRILFSIGQKKVIGKGRKVYTYYKNSHKPLSSNMARTTIDDISSSLPSYNVIMNPFKHKNKSPQINEQLIKINNTRMEACYTYILAILKYNNLGKLDTTIAVDLLKETLILLVRRKYGEMSTTKYDTIFPNLLNRIISEPNPVLAMQDFIKKEGYWISDQEFREHIVNRPLYRERDLLFTRMILQEVDKSLSTYGQLPDYTTLGSVEHVLPQTIDEHWKVYLGNDLNNTDLPRFSNTIGNLCLLSTPANSHAGRDPFESKKADYSDVSALTKDIKGRNVKWDISQIKLRSEFLCTKLLEIYAWKV